jgi:hypothetical protein
MLDGFIDELTQEAERNRIASEASELRSKQNEKDRSAFQKAKNEGTLDQYYEKSSEEHRRRVKESRAKEYPLAAQMGLTFEQFNRWPRSEKRIELDEVLRARSYAPTKPDPKPSVFSQQRIFVFAEGFILAAHQIMSSLSMLVEMNAGNDKLSEVSDHMRSRFPSLVEIRNSISHRDERSIATKRVRGKQKKIDLASSGGGVVVSDGPVLVSRSLDELVYHTTVSSGSQATIDITLDALNDLRMIVLATAHCFDWEGYENELPHIPRDDI